MQRANSIPSTEQTRFSRSCSNYFLTSVWAFLPCFLACALFLPTGCGTDLSSLDPGSSASDQSGTDQSDDSSTDDTAGYTDSLEDAASDNYEEQDDAAGYSWTSMSVVMA